MTYTLLPLKKPCFSSQFIFNSIEFFQLFTLEIKLWGEIRMWSWDLNGKAHTTFGIDHGVDMIKTYVTWWFSAKLKNAVNANIIYFLQNAHYEVTRLILNGLFCEILLSIIVFVKVLPRAFSKILLILPTGSILTVNESVID